ncbi:MAG TPA: polyphenol oxidase family protein [Dermatophilaceae bacterium]|nr:polyphenol oxidase family protein [Dermatophilaceae bacterium]
MFFWREQHAVGAGRRVDWGVTDRLGGTSRAPFDELNLGGHVGDDPGAVAANRSILAAAFDVPVDRLLFPAQCHGAAVAVADGPWAGAAPAADAVVTDRTDLAVGVLVADCVPVLLCDAASGVVGVAHAGRRGLLAGVVDAALDAMADLGAAAVRGVVGPSVCGRCYEVPEPMRAEAADLLPVAASVSWTGTPAIDVAAGVVERLRARGVALTWVPGCTREHDGLYSYRRDGRTGRLAGVVRRLP